MHPNPLPTNTPAPLMWPSTEAPTKLRINLSEKALVWSYFDRFKAWAWPAKQVDALAVSIQVKYPHLDLSDETTAARRRHALLLEKGPLTINR